MSRLLLLAGLLSLASAAFLYGKPGEHDAMRTAFALLAVSGLWGVGTHSIHGAGER